MNLEELKRRVERKEKVVDGQDRDAEQALSAVYEKHDIDKARHILTVAANCMANGERLPRIIELYLSEALGNIALGHDPGQSLHLKVNHKKKTSDDDLMNTYWRVELYKQKSVSERQAIAKYAAEVGDKHKTAESRYKMAKELFGGKFELMSKLAHKLELKKLKPNPSGLARAAQRVTGSNPPPNPDDFKRRLATLLGVPKKG